MVSHIAGENGTSLRVIGWDAESVYQSSSDRRQMFVEYLLSRPATETERSELQALGMSTRFRTLGVQESTDDIVGAMNQINLDLANLGSSASIE